MICFILSNTSEDEASSKGYQADCHPKWSAVQNYIIHAVSWLKLYAQVFDQWQQGGLLQNLLAGASHSLAALRDQFKEGSEPRKVVEALHTALLILSDSLAADGPRDSHLFAQILQHLSKLQGVVSDLSPWPVLKRLPLLDTVLRNVVTQDLRFVQGALSYLETSAKDFVPGGPDSWRLEKDVFFWGLKQLLTKKASATCLNGHLSQEVALHTGNASIWRSLWGVLCHVPSVNETSVLHELLHEVKDAGHSLQEIIAGHTDGTVSEQFGNLDWQELGTQLSEVNFTCSQVFKLPGAAASTENGISPGGCEYQLVSTVMSHILEEGQKSLEQVLYWKIFLGIIRKTCELAQYVNMHESFQNSPPHWKHIKDLFLRPGGMSDDITDWFQNIWQHIIALGNEMQKLFKGIFHSVLGNNSSSDTEAVFSVFSTSPKERDISRLGNSIYHLANYFALNLTHDLQNSSEIVPNEILKAVVLGIQLTRDVFNSLMPAIHFNIPQSSDHAQVLKKMTSLMHSLKKADIELLVGQLGQIGENLMSFFKNLSRSGVDNLGVHVLVGLVKTFVDSSHSWNVNHLLRFSRLLPKEVVNTVLDVYYALPHIVGLLQRVTEKNITESLRDIYNFTLLHGITMFNTTKEDFADVIKTLLDTVELVSDEPAVISEALMCLPRVWCLNHTTSRLEKNPEVEHCNVQGHMSSSFYHMVTSILDLLHLPHPTDSQCINENSGVEITRKVVCVTHEFADWSSILSELLEIFHVKNVLVKSLQGLWHKVLPFMSPSGNQVNGSIPELCPSSTIKQGALQVIEKLKYANFTKFLLHENILNKLVTQFLSQVNNSEDLSKFNQNLSVLEMCQVFLQLEKPSEAVEMLHRVEMMALHVLIIFAGGLLMLINSLKETWMTKIPVMMFLSNFTVTEDVKIKDLTKNVTKLTEDLRSSFPISDETIHSILEATISHSKVLSSVLTVALSGKCDEEILHLLLTFPESEKSWFVTRELCSLPGSQVFSLLMVMGQNLNLRNLIYKVSQKDQARSSSLASFQSVMKLLCKDQDSFLSNSNMFVNLPRVNELLEDDKEKFNIPHDSRQTLDKMFNHVGAGRFQFLGGILANLSSCVVLDRFQAVEAVDTLETKAHELMQQNSFLASFFFSQYMQMMGLHPAIHFLSWFLENMATLALSSAALAAILKMSGIFMHSDAFIVFLFLLDFGVSAVMLSYFLSVFFNQANTAALCTSLGYMISFLPYVVLLVLHNQLSFTIQTLLVSEILCKNESKTNRSMLMGLYPPTSGTIIINGKNLQTDLSKVREELGVCPQQDVLLDNLTVREHLMLFASIKAPWWTKQERQQQVNKTLDEVELTLHQHKPARVLSGGMKRKLSIGIAFMGMSKTVVLDEPSSGVDPCSRRSLWDILLKYREGRTIIFTTHHLDEAEMLSDHVAVLQQGRLRCYAPPAGLKETYGQGLTLTLTKQPSILETQEPKDVAHVTSLIQVYIPQAFLKNSSGGELTYTIPKDADKTCFKGLCQALDQNLHHLHLTGYGISDTTLEEVPADMFPWQVP
ncbi:hypothetical protein NN561_005268 [Cricetulus griseus]